MSLVDPAGVSVPLVRSGGSGTTALTATTFSDDAPTPFAQGIAPFSSIAGYQPASPLSAFLGASGNGTWSLHVSSSNTKLTPFLVSWGLQLKVAAEPTVVTGSAGTYAFNNLPMATTYQVGVLPPTGRVMTTYANFAETPNTQYADFGTFVPVTVHPTVFEDTKGTGVYQAGDPLIDDQDVYLDSNDNGQFDADAAPVTYSSSATLKPANGAVSLPITVTGRYLSLDDVTTSLSISETGGNGGMTAYLVSPTGMRVALFTLPSSSGVVSATFSDAAARPAPATAPSTGLIGSFQPYAQNTLAALDGEDPDGQWNLVVVPSVANGAALPSSVRVTGSVLVQSEEPLLVANTSTTPNTLRPGTPVNCSKKGKVCVPAILRFSVFNKATTGDSPALVFANPIVTTARVVLVTLTSGATTPLSFGQSTPASIAGTVFNDLNNNSVLNSGETGVAGATVYLDRSGDGKLDAPAVYAYNFTAGEAIAGGVPAASDQATSVTSNGLITSVSVLPVTSPVNGKAVTYVLTSPAGQSATFQSTGAATVLTDFNGERASGIWTLQATGLATYAGTLTSWKLAISVGDPSVVTAANGTYSFGNLTPGQSYTVRDVLPAATDQATAAVPATLAVGQQLTENLGIHANAPAGHYLITGSVFNDANANGTWDGGEATLSGWEIYLDVGNAGAFKAGDPFTFAGVGGGFSIGLTSAGVLREVVPANWTQTNPTANGGFAVSAASPYNNFNFGDHTAVKYLSTVATTPGLAAWWTFDAAAQANSVVNGITGTLVGGATIATTAGAPISGEATSTGLSLNGTGAFVNTNLTTQDEFATAATINVWIDLGSTPAQSGHFYTIAAKSQFRNDLDLQVETDGEVHFYTDIGSSVAFNPASLGESLSGWHMVTATFDTAAQVRQIYWDGQLVAADVPYTGAHAANPLPFSIGESDVFTGRYLDGGIDEVALWTQALTASQILAIYGAATGE